MPRPLRTSFLSRRFARVTSLVTAMVVGVASGVATVGLTAKVAAADTYSTAILTAPHPAPLGYWRLNDAGPTTAADSSGNGNTCSSAGTAPPTFGSTGLLATSSDTAAAFAQGPTFLQCPSFSLDGSSALSLEAWVKVTANGWPNTLLGVGAPGGGNDFTLGTQRDGTANQFTFSASGSTSGSVLVAGPDLVLGNTYHVVGVYSSGTLSLYVDGSLFATGSIVGTLVAHGHLDIGGDPAASGGNGSTGTIDEVALYTSALTDTEVNDDFVAGNPGPGAQQDAYSATTSAYGPLGYWRLDDPSSSQFAQGAVPGQNCVPRGAPTFASASVLATTSNASVAVSATPADLQCPFYDLDGGSATLTGWLYPTNIAWPGSFLGIGTPGGGNDFQIGEERDAGTGTRLVFHATTTAGNATVISANFASGLAGGLTFITRPLFVAGVVSGGTASLYVNGTLVGTDSPGGTLLAHGNLGIGIDPVNSLTSDGRIDEVAVFDRALTGSQIQGLAAAGDPAFAPSPPPIVPAAPIGPIGPPEFQTGHNASSGCACLSASGHHTAKPVITPWGNFTHTFDDLSIPERGPALAFGRTYSSYPNASVPNGLLGYGWTDPYAMQLTLSGTAPHRTATIAQEDGAQVQFFESGSNTWIPAAPRVIATLAYNSGPGTYTFRRRATDVITFDAATGHLNSIADPNGNALTMSYSSGKLQTVTDDTSRTLTFAYVASGNGAGNIQSVTDSASRSVTFTYDSAGNLATATEPNGGVWNFTYDASHRMLTMLDPNQDGSLTPEPVTNHYDGSGRVDWQQDELNRQTDFDYSGLDAAGLNGTVLITDPQGNVVQEHYTDGEKDSVTTGYGEADAATTQYGYDPYTLMPTEVLDANNHAWLYSYDANGNVLSATDPLGNQIVNTWNAFNEPFTAQDPNGIATTYMYDNSNAGYNLVSIATPCSTAMSDCPAAPNNIQTTTFNHTDMSHPGDVTSMVDANGKTWTYTYDSAGDRQSVTDPLTNQSKTCYDSLGQVSATIAPKGVASSVTCATTAPAAYTTYYTYDALGGVLTTQLPGGDCSATPKVRCTISTYDDDHNLLTAQDRNHNTTTYVYDLAGERTQAQRPDTTTVTTDFNDDGTILDQKDGKGNAIQTFGYDHSGRLTSVTDADSNTTSYTLDDAGNVLAKQLPGGNCAAMPKTGCTTYTYDNADELKTVTYSDNTPDITNVDYDADGQRTHMTDGTGTSTWKFDSLHRIYSTTDGVGNVVGYTYDLNDSLTSITYPGSHTVTYAPDDDSRSHTVADWLSHTTTLDYDANSNLQTITYPSSPNLVDTYTYNSADQLTGISDVASAATLFSASYGRDNNGQLTSDSSVPSSAGTFGYTSLNQLCAATSTGSCAGTPTYAYDAADNLTANNGTAQQYDAADRLCWTYIGTSGNACGSAPAGASTYTYDASGNRTQVVPANGTPTVHYGYDQANRLTSLNGSGYQPTVLAASPSADWHLDEAAGATTAADASGNSHSGTYPTQTSNCKNGTVSANATGTASATFDATSSCYITIGGSGVGAGGSSVFSVEAWIKTGATSSPYIVAEGSTSTNNPFDGLHLDASGHAVFTVRDNSMTSAAATSAAVVNDNKWHFIVGERNGNNLALYVDGKADGTASAALGTETLNDTTIGALKRTTVSNNLAGSVDEPAFYSSALTPAQVANHYLAGLSNYTGSVGSAGPVGLWRLGETSGTSAADISQNSHAGTYTSSTHYTLGATAGPIANDPTAAVTFDGNATSGGYVNVSGGLSAGGLSNYSVDAWVKTTGNGSSNNYVVASGDTASAMPFTGIHVNSTSVNHGFAAFTVAGASANVTVTGTANVGDGNWHYLVGVRNGSTLSIYVDGKFDASTSGTPGSMTGLNTTTIGALSRTSVANRLAGSVANGAYYNTSLTGTQISLNYANALRPTAADSYTYNGDGLRASKTVNGITTSYVWDTTTSVPLLLQETTGSTTVNYIYNTDGTPLEQIVGSTPLYYSTDQQGSVRLITDGTGTSKASYTYGPYGNTTASSVAAGTTNSLGYDGEYTDPETALFYLRNRYYDPATMQWLSRDPLVAETQSAYGYVDGNPLNFVDPLGLYLGQGFVHKAVHVVKVAVNTAAKVAALPPYADYYVIYRTQSSIGSHLPRPVNSAITNVDNDYLTVDQWLDRVKRATGSKESTNDENVNGGILPFHISGLDKNPCDPLYTYLPGVHANGDRDLYPNHSYPWGAGWGPIPLGP